MLNRIALAFVIAMLYMFAFVLPYGLYIDQSSYLYPLQFIGLFFGFWGVALIVTHFDKILRWYFHPKVTEDDLLRDL